MAKTVSKPVARKPAPKRFSVELHFVFEKETSGTYRFKECAEDGEPIEDKDDIVVGTLYVRKVKFKVAPSDGDILDVNINAQ